MAAVGVRKGADFCHFGAIVANFWQYFRALGSTICKGIFVPDRRAIGAGWRGGEDMVEVPLLKSPENDSDLYTSLVMSFAISG